MFSSYSPLFVLSFATVVALAGHPGESLLHHRSRKHLAHLHRDNSANYTTRDAPAAKGGPMRLVDKFAGKHFFDHWNFFTDSDPTHGLVDYVSKDDATSYGLASVGDDNVTVLAVDDSSRISVGSNRKSVRITSKKSYTGGLFVIDVNAMPTGCAIWPAFWTVAGENWPKNGEIDIIEGVNLQTHNQMTLHTAPGCMLDKAAAPNLNNSKAFLGNVLSTTCNALLDSNSGCGVTDPNPQSYGPGIEKGNGAVFAMLWDSVGIRIWHFNRANTPADLSDFTPDPITWPVPSAFWSTTTCPVNKFFKNHNIVINTSLCGDFAGSTYPSSGCPGTCAEHVADPANFVNAKWKINYVATYQ
ncbi:glycoside hydrolase family 16 protein [Hysterangium stoloniferum]|nr:glycoside hydrolase family 16 protein [Hysterangium stoloniferum]